MRGSGLSNTISNPIIPLFLLLCTLSLQAAEDVATLAPAQWLATLYGITPEAVLRNGRMAAAALNAQNLTLDAPLANRSLLEYALPYVKLNAAAYSDFGLLGGLLNSQVRTDCFTD